MLNVWKSQNVVRESLRRRRSIAVFLRVINSMLIRGKPFFSFISSVLPNQAVRLHFALRKILVLPIAKNANYFILTHWPPADIKHSNDIALFPYQIVRKPLIVRCDKFRRKRVFPNSSTMQFLSPIIRSIPDHIGRSGITESHRASVVPYGGSHRIKSTDPRGSFRNTERQSALNSSSFDFTLKLFCENRKLSNAGGVKNFLQAIFDMVYATLSLFFFRFLG